MKTKSFVYFSTALLLSAFSLQFSAFSQGSLTPPGAPAPTMKTLSQIEPRTPINTLSGDSDDLYIISKPGSYYLTTNITATTFFNAISINTNGVTLDLNGFTISTTGSSGYGIYLPGNEASLTGNSDISISNGHITGGFSGGISYNVTGGTPHNIRVTGVTVTGGYYGIYLNIGNSTVVESCTVNTVGAYGIEASSVSHSTAIQCGSTAIAADNASDCYGNCTGSGGGGLYVSYAANNCSGICTGSGIGLDATTANNCYGSSYSGSGIYLIGTATGCTGSSTLGDGLDAISANNCWGSSSSSGTGLNANIVATGCYGYGVTGVSAPIAIGCYGIGSSTGVSADIANSCYGFSGFGTGVSATIANSCLVAAGTTNITYKYNMP